VHWTVAISPVIVDSSITVVAGGTLIIDPDVEVFVQASSTFAVEGILQVDAGVVLSISQGSRLRIEGVASLSGTSAQPVTVLGGVTPGNWRVDVLFGGQLTLDWVVSDVHFRAGPYGSLVASNATLTGTAPPQSPAESYDTPGFSAWKGMLAVRDTNLVNGTVEVLGGYALLDGLDLDSSRIKTQRYNGAQPLFIDNITAHDFAGDAPFQFFGYDVLLGGGNSITNNLYPVRLEGGGLASGSVVPASGNTNNFVHGGYGGMYGIVTFADVGVPYLIEFDEGFPTVGAQLTIEPGAIVEFGPDAYLAAQGGARIDARGTPSEPVTFRRFDPGQSWAGISFGSNSTRPTLQHCIVEGADIGVGTADTVTRIESCLIHNNDRGARSSTFGRISAAGTRFLNNTAGVQTSPGSGGGTNAGNASLNGATNPNTFDGNGIGLEVLNPDRHPDATLNWWGDSSGPNHPSNPGGGGDSASASAIVVPFRAEAPDPLDPPPLVRMVQPYFLLEEGQQVLLHWSVEENSAITGQRILYSPHSENPDLEVLLDDLAPGQRSAMITVPQSPPSSNIAPPVLRVVAVDDAGQEGWDEAMFATPYEDFTGSVVPDPMPPLMRPGETADVCWQVLGGASGGVDAYLFLEGDVQAISQGGAHTGVDCLPLGLTAPGVSTDTARVGLRYNSGAGGRYRWEFTPEFSIRPTTLIGDAPPTVTLLTPSAGEIWEGGSAIPISWVAADDEAVRAFDLQASYDGGRTWHFIVRDLPADTVAWDWLPPLDADLPAVGVRVLVRDLRFQNTRATMDGSIAIVPGMPTVEIFADGFESGDTSAWSTTVN
jgi:hypothetical protein